ncbi:NUDIX domain-containing protein [Pelagibacterium luteolum]|uniref:GDP-mannose pyrophosphatase n=1 Tax=Pelagibacterium luteolum TaxID=440168 RepID=A0A1G7SAW3_9HYPH|nr:NUDIX domain-containing protein [Pelagibacterium luteolum]SDG20185.1 nudix-type nucleoside diphosphatase, YffH/AdpP family [Pelagibacterium luteolum]
MSPKPLIAITSKKILAKAWGSLTEYVFDYLHSDGGQTSIKREVYDHGSAAAILLLDPDQRLITLVRQFRLPPHLNGNDPMMLEVCAGLLDGDTPEVCAKKEAVEETGIAPRDIVFAFDIYASPGSLTEKVSCFIGFYGEADRIGAGGGLDHEDEDIEIVTIRYDQALPMIASGAIIDAKTVALIQHAALSGHFG